MDTSSVFPAFDSADNEVSAAGSGGPSSTGFSLSQCDSWSVIGSEERNYYALVEDLAVDDDRSNARGPTNFSEDVALMAEGASADVAGTRVENMHRTWRARRRSMIQM